MNKNEKFINVGAMMLQSELLNDIRIQLDLGNYSKAKILSEIYKNIGGDSNE